MTPFCLVNPCVFRGEKTSWPFRSCGRDADPAGPEPVSHGWPWYVDEDFLTRSWVFQLINSGQQLLDNGSMI